MRAVLAIDPGREKCGLAVVSGNGALYKAVVPRREIAPAVEALLAEHQVDNIIIGNGTGADKLFKELECAGLAIPIELVDEKYSSQRARERFLQDNPPRGLRRLIPRGLLTPDRPYDDYVALILAEDYLNKR